METTIKDGVLKTLTPYGLELCTIANLYNVLSYVSTANGKVIYKVEIEVFSASEERVRRIHDADVTDFLKRAKVADLRKPLNF